METQQAPQYCQSRLQSLLSPVADPRSKTTRRTENEDAIDYDRQTYVNGNVFINDDEGEGYAKGCLLGKGGFASVYIFTKDNVDKTQLAGKVISKKRILKPEKKDKISREIDIHRKMCHVNVVQFVKFFEDKYNVYILMENCGGMTLSKILKTRLTLTEPEVRYYLRQLIAGCDHIHSQGVVHRDLKLSNLFITEQMHLKIGDFGLSAYISNPDEKKESICGTPNYISPEVIHKQGHSYPADIWAIGCIIYALLSGRPPFETDCLKDTYKLISKSRYNEPTTASINARYLIAKCLKVEPQERPTLREMRSDPFINSGPTPTSLERSAAKETPTITDTQNYSDEVDYANIVPVVTMEYFLESLKGLELCAEGGKELGHHFTSTYACTRLLDALKTTIAKIKGWECKKNPTAKPNDDFIWITKWVDYSHKYGFGFQLSNDVSGASFKDQFSIAVTGGGRYVGLQDPSEGVSIRCPVEQLSPDYHRRLQVMNYFVKYMNDTLIKGSDADDQQAEIPNLSDVFMLRWQRTKHSIFMALSSGIVQVNWLADHTKLVVAETKVGFQIMYINKRRQASIYNLSDIAKYGCTKEVNLRLQYVFGLLDQLLETKKREECQR